MKQLFELFIFGSFFSVCSCGYLLHSIEGEVGRGNYTYYSLMYEGPISLKLFTLSGDADLYISQHISKPTYELDSHCLLSASCGVDNIDIPRRFARPIGIGVYGHPSHEVSRYLLQVIHQDWEESLHYQDLDEEAANYPSPERNFSGGEEVEEESFLWSLVWSVTEIVLEVLLL